MAVAAAGNFYDIHPIGPGHQFWKCFWLADELHAGFQLFRRFHQIKRWFLFCKFDLDHGANCSHLYNACLPGWLCVGDLQVSLVGAAVLSVHRW